MGCPKGWRCLARWWGRCVFGIPGWDSCCWRITDPICLLANAGCWVLKKTLELGVTIAIGFVNVGKVAIDIAKGFLTVAQGAVNLAKGVLQGAIYFLEGVKRLYRIGVEALAAIASFVLTQIINIREVYFRVGLSVANGGEFECRIKGVLLGNNIDIHLKFDTRNIWSLAKALAEKAISGLSKFIG